MDLTDTDLTCGQQPEDAQPGPGRTVSPGAVYTALDRLEAKGLVTSWLGEDTPARGGRKRKFCKLTPAGAELLLESYTALQSMAEGAISELRDLVPQGGGK